MATVITLSTTMVLARLFSKTELAVYRQTLLAYNMAAPVLSLGLATGLYYFLPNEIKRLRGVVVDGLILMLAMGVLYALFLAAGGNLLLAQRFSNPQIGHTLMLFIPYPIFALPASLLSAVLVVRERITQLSVFNIVSNLCLGLLVVSSCLIWRSPESAVLGTVGATMLMSLIAVILILKSLPQDDWRPSTLNMKAMVSYSLPLGLASMMGTVALQLDKLIVSSMCSPEQFAVYSNGALEIPLIGIITGAMSTVILADMTAHCQRGEYREALTLFKKRGGRSAMLLLPTMAFLLVYAQEFITLLFSFKYTASVAIFRIYLLVLPVRIVMYGAAWATALTLALWTVPINMHMIARGFKCRWHQVLPLQQIGLLAAFSTVAVAIAYACTALLSLHNRLLLLGIGSVVFATVYTALCYYFLPETREIVFQIRNKIRFT